MSSGRYFPPPVRAVEIPKSQGRGANSRGVDGGAMGRADGRGHVAGGSTSRFSMRIPMVTARSGALDALAKCRERCWKNDWVVDLDIQKFFDSVPWRLMLKAVAHHIDAARRWILLYVERWLQAPLRQGRRDDHGEGTAEPRRVRRFRLYWLICSCTMRSTRG